MVDADYGVRYPLMKCYLSPQFRSGESLGLPVSLLLIPCEKGRPVTE
jgi:hypothetical protein